MGGWHLESNLWLNYSRYVCLVGWVGDVHHHLWEGLGGLKVAAHLVVTYNSGLDQFSGIPYGEGVWGWTLCRKRCRRPVIFEHEGFQVSKWINWVVNGAWGSIIQIDVNGDYVYLNWVSGMSNERRGTLGMRFMQGIWGKYVTTKLFWLKQCGQLVGQIGVCVCLKSQWLRGLYLFKLGKLYINEKGGTPQKTSMANILQRSQI